MAVEFTDCPLTPKQLRVIVGLAEGLTYKQIARRDCVAETTIRTHLHLAYTRLGVDDRAQAVITCVRHGWVSWNSDTNIQLDIERRLVALLERIAQAAEGRKQLLTSRQRDYLDTFADGRSNTDLSRQRRRRALQAVLKEASLPLSCEDLLRRANRSFGL